MAPPPATVGATAARGPAGAANAWNARTRASARAGPEGWVLRGDTGTVVWRQGGLIAGTESAMPFGSDLPAVADLDGNGIDDLVQAFYLIYAATDGDTGKPIFPPSFLPGPGHFGKWIAYSSPTLADLHGDGKLDVYLNSASYARGGCAAVRADGRPLCPPSRAARG